MYIKLSNYLASVEEVNTHYLKIFKASLQQLKSFPTIYETVVRLIDDEILEELG